MTIDFGPKYTIEYESRRFSYQHQIPLWIKIRKHDSFHVFFDFWQEPFHISRRFRIYGKFRIKITFLFVLEKKNHTLTTWNMFISVILDQDTNIYTEKNF